MTTTTETVTIPLNYHTPGPWAICEHDHANVIWADNGVICDVFHANEDDEMTASVESREESEANARLIAAAPQLLAALQKIAEMDGDGSWNTSEFHALCSIAKAAITKATGRAVA